MQFINFQPKEERKSEGVTRPPLRGSFGNEKENVRQSRLSPSAEHNGNKASGTTTQIPRLTDFNPLKPKIISAPQPKYSLPKTNGQKSKNKNLGPVTKPALRNQPVNLMKPHRLKNSVSDK